LAGWYAWLGQYPHNVNNYASRQISSQLKICESVGGQAGSWQSGEIRYNRLVHTEIAQPHEIVAIDMCATST